MALVRDGKTGIAGSAIGIRPNSPQVQLEATISWATESWWNQELEKTETLKF
jgi:hypothetical protein